MRFKIVLIFVIVLISPVFALEAGKLFINNVEIPILKEAEQSPLIMTIDDKADTLDVVFLIDIGSNLENKGYKIPSAVLFSEVNALELDDKLTIAVYKKKTIIIVGKEISKYIDLLIGIEKILDEKGAVYTENYITISSNEIKTSNLIDLFEEFFPEPICNTCGNGLFNLCDEEECMGLGGCLYEDKTFLTKGCNDVPENFQEDLRRKIEQKFEEGLLSSIKDVNACLIVKINKQRTHSYDINSVDEDIIVKNSDNLKCDGISEEDIIISYHKFSGLDKFIIEDSCDVLKRTNLDKYHFWESKFVKPGFEVDCTPEFERKYCDVVRKCSSKEELEQIGCCTCVDSDVTEEYPDGRNYYLKGNVKVGNYGGNDCCSINGVCDPNGNQLNEFICDSENPNGLSYHLYNCPNGCDNDSCIKITCSENEIYIKSYDKCISKPSTTPLMIKDIINAESTYYAGLEEYFIYDISKEDAWNDFFIKLFGFIKYGGFIDRNSLQEEKRLSILEYNYAKLPIRKLDYETDKGLIKSYIPFINYGIKCYYVADDGSIYDGVCEGDIPKFSLNYDEAMVPEHLVTGKVSCEFAIENNFEKINPKCEDNNLVSDYIDRENNLFAINCVVEECGNYVCVDDNKKQYCPNNEPCCMAISDCDTVMNGPILTSSGGVCIDGNVGYEYVLSNVNTLIEGGTAQNPTVAIVQIPTLAYNCIIEECDDDEFCKNSTEECLYKFPSITPLKIKDIGTEYGHGLGGFVSRDSKYVIFYFSMSDYYNYRNWLGYVHSGVYYDVYKSNEDSALSIRSYGDKKEVTVDTDKGSFDIYLPEMYYSNGNQYYVAEDGSTYYSRSDHYTYPMWNLPDLTPEQAMTERDENGNLKHLARDARCKTKADCQINHKIKETYICNGKVISSGDTVVYDCINNKCVPEIKYYTFVQVCDEDEYCIDGIKHCVKQEEEFFPIGIYAYGDMYDFQLDDIKNLNFNTIIGSPPFGDYFEEGQGYEENFKDLFKRAKRRGLKVIPLGTYTYEYIMGITNEFGRQNPETIKNAIINDMNKFYGQDSLYKFYLSDEPIGNEKEKWEDYVIANDFIKKKGLNHLFVAPYYGHHLDKFRDAGPEDTFRNYNELINYIKPSEIFKDVYPYKKGQSYEDVQTEWDNTVRIIFEPLRKASVEECVPWWFIGQVHGAKEGVERPEREPTPAEINLEIYMALAYGAKGIFYWYYPSGNEYYGLISQGRGFFADRLTKGTDINIENYRIQPKYDAVKKLNKELEILGPLLLNLKSTDAGNSQKIISSLITSVFGNFEIGVFEDKYNEKYIMLVNRNTINSQTAQIELDRSDLDYLGPNILQLKDVLTDEIFEPIDSYYSDKYSITIEPGHGRLFKITSLSPNLICQKCMDDDICTETECKDLGEFCEFDEYYDECLFWDKI